MKPALAPSLTQLSPQEARQIAREAYTYGFPLVTNYETLHKQAVDTTGHDYRAPFNSIASLSNVATPEDKFVVTPNSDTPYSFLWMDLRAEPIVVTMPKVEESRYYSGQLIDLYTFNFAYLGTRSYGNEGGDFLVAGPGWSGDAPKGIKAVLNCETEFAYILFRTQLFNPGDLENVKKIQAGYRAQPLSKFLGKPVPTPAPAVNWPAPAPDILTSPALFSYLNFMLQFCPTNPTEADLMERFAKLDIGAGKTFNFSKLSPELQTAVTGGIADVGQDAGALMKRINAGEVASFEVFGTREFLKNNYLYRFIGAKLGLYGNSGEEAIYLPYFIDVDHQPVDAGKASYTLCFPKGQLPPAKSFWSLTMYDGKTQFLVANPIKRYLLNSTMLESFKYGDDGSLTFYVQKDSPGGAEESNWLPAPDGTFYAILRLYIPGTEVRTGAWRAPGFWALSTPTLQKTRDTRIGKIELEQGFPSKASVTKLYDELDFQRACQAYIWGLPIVGFAEWQQSVAKSLSVGNLDYVRYLSVRDKLGILTPNNTTPYILAFPNLAESGALVVEVPAGPSGGGVLDFWQRPITDTGFPGPDKGEGGNYLILPPGSSDIQADGYHVFRSPTFNIMVGTRALHPDPSKAEAWIKQLRIYPLSQKDNPPATRVLSPEGRQWSQVPPRGLTYWERLADILNREPVEERDRFFMAMLVPLGIEKGKPFKPDARQEKLLEEATFVGEAMAMTISFSSRTEGSLYRPEANWRYVIMLDPSQETKYFSQLDERTDYFYQAVTTSKGMVSKTPGVGSAYLGAYELQEDGSRLDGGKTYRLRVPPNAPAKQFWSVTLYDVDTRSFIVNKEQIVDRSSRQDLKKNADGSVDIYMGPTAPKGFEKNWITTVPGRGWFTLFRLYAPTEAYFDKSWPLPPIELVK